MPEIFVNEKIYGKNTSSEHKTKIRLENNMFSPGFNINAD